MIRHNNLFFRSIIAFGLLCGFAWLWQQNTLPPSQHPNQEAETIIFQENTWKMIQPGLEAMRASIEIPENIVPYDEDGTPEKRNFLIVRIDPRQFTFSIFQNPSKENAKTLEQISQQEDTIVSFNGQFFSEDFKPLGLLISGGDQLHTASNSNLFNGTITISNDGTAELHENNTPTNNANLTFALQNGPILLTQQGSIGIQSDDGKTASRTAMGVDNQGNIIVIIMKQSFLNMKNTLSLYQLAHLLHDHPTFEALGLQGVLNLDGGPSTGIMLGPNYYSEMAVVQNVILVKER